jgi:hypothetical protein
MLRWNVLTNAIPFRDSFRLDFEYGARKPETAINYSSVAFYYLRGASLGETSETTLAVSLVSAAF